MAGSLNRVQLIGNLGADPEVRTLQNGSKVVNISVATSETWRDKDSGEKRERTEWHRVVIWNENIGKVVEQYTRKGSKVFIEGELQTRKYEKDGVERYATEIVLTGFKGSVVLLGEGGGRGGSDPNGNASRPGNSYREASGGDGFGRGAPDPSLDLDDDIPF